MPSDSFLKTRSTKFFKKMLTLTHLLFWLLPTASDAQFLVKSPDRSMLDSLRRQHPELPTTTPLPKEIHPDFLPDTLPDPQMMTANQVIFHSFQLADWSVSLENMFAQHAARATYAKKGLGDQIAVAQRDSAVSKQSLKDMKTALAQLKSLEATAVKRAKQATKTADFGMKLTQMDVDEMRKNLPKMHQQVMDLIQLSKENAALQAAIDLNAAVPSQLPKVQPLEVPTTEKIKADAAAATAEAAAEPAQTEKTEKKKKEKKPKKQPKKEEPTEPSAAETAAAEPAATQNPSAEPPATTATETPTVSEILNKNIEEVAKNQTARPTTLAKYDPRRDVMLNPPQPSCQFNFKGKDEFSGQIRREMRAEQWFTYTNDFMKSFLRDRAHITCFANVSTAGNMVFLNLNFSILEQNAMKTFGGINKGGQAVLKLMDGQTYPIASFRQDLGEVDDSGQVTTFKMQFVLDKTLLKKLRQFEVDKIRIGWNKGFEDYEIYSVDLLQQQLRCLEEG